ncbi:MAG TPA: TldD/PmbA family protein [Cyanobacteria bacterium UBA8803]|nr:TldD/PmbA family protein [Cyanobacteria bacterium UBA9273]HBL62838.1 TldD/PmbA family protein [Cyanobacteria bacterium UBA8803]
MSDATLEKTLNLAREHAEAAEVYYLASQDQLVEFENNRLKSLSTRAIQGVALRVICQGRLGFASSTDLTRLEDLIAAAVQTSESGDRTELEFATGLQLTAPKTNYRPPPTQEFVARGERLIEQVRAYNPDILVNIKFNIRSSSVKIATSNNVSAQRSSQILSASLLGNLIKGEDFLKAYSHEVVRDAFPNCDRLLEELLQKYQRAELSAAIASGSCPVLFTPTAAASTIGRLFDTILSGQTVVQKASPLVDKVGEMLFDPRLTLFEDPTIGPSACPFDDEGTLTTPKVLIDSGVVKQFYWDRRSGGQASCPPSGNGFRNGLSRPQPQLVNLCLMPGQTTTADLIAGINEGLIVDQVLGAGQSNQLAGEFSVNLDLGYKVEKGEIVGRVKNTMVAGSIFEAFKTLVDSGSSREWVGGRAYLPCLLFEQLGVAARH